jgi:hypothetical protein
VGRLDFPLDGMQIGMAYTAGMDFQENLPMVWMRNRYFCELEGVILSRFEFKELHVSHSHFLSIGFMILGSNYSEITSPGQGSYPISIERTDVTNTDGGG